MHIHTHTHIQIHIKHKIVWVCFLFFRSITFYELPFNLPFICSDTFKFYLCMCVCSVVQSCPTLCHPMDCSPPGCPWNFQQRILEWAAISFSRVSFQPSDQPSSPESPVLAGRFFTTWEAYVCIYHLFIHKYHGISIIKLTHFF